MKKATAPETLVPPELIPQIEAIAEADRREPREVVGEVLERYLEERRAFPRDDLHERLPKGFVPFSREEASTAKLSLPNCWRNSVCRGPRDKCRASSYRRKHGTIFAKSETTGGAKADSALPAMC